MRKRYTVHDGELYHADQWDNHKYIKREWKNGRWNYTYKDPNQSLKTRFYNKVVSRAQSGVVNTTNKVKRTARNVRDKVDNAKDAVKTAAGNVARRALYKGVQKIINSEYTTKSVKNGRVTYTYDPAKARQGRRQKRAQAVSNAVNTAKNAVNSAAKSTTQKVTRAKKRAESVVKNYAKTTMSDVSSLGKKTKNRVAQTMSRIDSKAKERVNSVATNARDKLKKAADRAEVKLTAKKRKKQANKSKTRGSSTSRSNMN